MKFTALLMAIVAMLMASCFKKPGVNEHALLQQRSCVMALDLHDYERAQVHCELCLEFDSSMPECLNGIGLAALAQKDYARAHEFFIKAVRQNNEYTPARNNLGVLHFMKGDFSKALPYFTQSLEIDPSNVDARYNRGLSLFRLAQKALGQDHKLQSLKLLAEAKDQMLKLVAVEPGFSAAYRDLGLIEFNRYQLTDLVQERQVMLSSSQDMFESCIKSNKQYAPCYEGLGQVFAEKAAFDQAFQNYFLCLSYEPGNSTCRSNIVGVYEKSAQAEGGYQKFVSIVKSEPNNANAHFAFCKALFERGFDAEARKECEVALRLKPDTCGAHFELAQHYAKLLDANSASRYCHSFLACGGGKNVPKEAELCREILASLRE